MKRNVRWSLRITLLATMAAIVFAGPAQAQQQIMPPIAIPSLGGDCNHPRDINDQGVVVGQACPAHGGPGIHAYRWTRSDGLVDLHDVGLIGDTSDAQRVNASGQIAGTVVVGGFTRVFLWSNGSMVDLGPVLANTTNARVHELHDNGSLTGFYEDGTVSHAFMWSPTTGFQNLNPPGALTSVGRDINAAGDVVGTFTTETYRHAFVYRNGTFTDVTPDAGCAEGIEIIDSGRVAGIYNCESLQTVFTSLDGNLELLPAAHGMSGSFFGGPWEAARSMNESGVLTGSDDYVAWTWKSGEAVTLLNPNGETFYPLVINDNGVVGGSGGNALQPYFWSAQAGLVPGGGGDYIFVTAIAANGAVGFSLATQGGVFWKFASPPTVTVQVASLIGASSMGGAPVTFTATSTSGTPACTVGGQPFSPGNVLAPGDHTIVCTATDPEDLLTGQATASTTVIYIAGITGGAPGPEGPAGPQGIPGAAGPQGAKGDKGDQGDAGAPGADGAPGPMGETGAAGATGADGAMGPVGPAGPAGANGADGAVGPMGPTGAQGAPGAPGPQGVAGPAGPAGSGPQGSLVFLPVGAPAPDGYSPIGRYELKAANNPLAVQLFVDVYAFGAPVVVEPPSPAASANVRQAPVLNGQTRLEGSLRVMQAANITLNGSTVVTGDLIVPGTPTVKVNGQVTFGGVAEGAGAATPTGHQVTLNGGVTLGRLITRTNPAALAAVSAPPPPAGTRNVSLNKATDSPGNFATLRDLTLNGTVGAVAVPPGTYGTFTANGSNRLVLGVAGATGPAVYHFDTLVLNGTSHVEVVGPVVVTLKNGLSVNGSGMGASARPEWLTLRIATGGLTLNGNATFDGALEAPSGEVALNSTSRFTGRLIAADRLTLNGQSRLVQR